MLDSICDVLKKAYDHGWISTRDGNASYKRKDEPYVYITPSGVRIYHLNGEMLIKLKLNDINEFTTNIDTLLESVERIDDDYQRKIIGLYPSGELPLHLLLQHKTHENRVVLHLHPTYIIAAMYAGLDLQQLAKDFPEINRYTRVGVTVPVIPPISRELAEASIQALGLKADGTVESDIIGLDRHGVIAIAKDAWSAFEHVERLEHICKIALAARR